MSTDGYHLSSISNSLLSLSNSFCQVVIHVHGKCLIRLQRGKGAAQSLYSLKLAVQVEKTPKFTFWDQLPNARDGLKAPGLMFCSTIFVSNLTETLLFVKIVSFIFVISLNFCEVVMCWIARPVKEIKLIVFAIFCCVLEFHFYKHRC